MDYLENQSQLKDNYFDMFISQFKEPFDESYKTITLDEEVIVGLVYPDFDETNIIDIFYEDDLENYHYMEQDEKIREVLKIDYIKENYCSREYFTWSNVFLDYYTVKFRDKDISNPIKNGNVYLDDMCRVNYRGSFTFKKTGRDCRVDLVPYNGLIHNKIPSKYQLYYRGKLQSDTKRLKHICLEIKYDVGSNLDSFKKIISDHYTDRLVDKSKYMVVYDINLYRFVRIIFSNYPEDVCNNVKDYVVLSADVRDSTYAFYQVGDIIDDNYIVVYFE